MRGGLRSLGKAGLLDIARNVRFMVSGPTSFSTQTLMEQKELNIRLQRPEIIPDMLHIFSDKKVGHGGSAQVCIRLFLFLIFFLIKN